MQELSHIWQTLEPYKNEINFLIYIPLFFIIRSVLLKRVRKMLKASFEENRMYPFILSLVNWSTFYAILFYAIAYFKDTFWLGKTWFHVGNTPVNTLSFLIPLVIISLAVKISKLISEFFLDKVYDRYDLEKGMRYNFNRLLQYGIIVISVLVALPSIGFDLGILTVFAGVLGIGVGFGIQNIVSNFISGLIILFERPIKVGDRIKLVDLHCDVEHIGDSKIRQQILVGVAYGSDVRLVEKLLMSAAEEHQQVLTDPPPRVDFLNFGESSLDFRLLYWLGDPVIRTRVKSALNFRINELFQEHGVEIPFPQRDINLRSVDADIMKNIQVEYESPTPRQ